MHRVMHGAFAGAQHMQHCGECPAMTSFKSSNPDCCTVA
jgi:hypothetical protein